MAKLRQAKFSITQIAEALWRSKSTISRELRRNSIQNGQYWPDTAQKRTRERKKRPCRIDQNSDLKGFILTKLCCYFWTPEKISGWLCKRQKTLKKVSHETIYTWLYKGPQIKEKLWKFLPRHKAKRGLRKSIKTGVNRILGRISIHERPKSVKNKKNFGHWEGDLMSFMKNSKHILVLRERKTMFTQSIPLPSKKAASTAKNIIDLLQNMPPKARKNITFDNGGEFAQHQKVAEFLGLKTYFCDAYASWQKGGVENTNGRLRRDLPRNTDIKNMKQEDFDEIIDNYNRTPRKSIKWFTPLEMFNKNLHSVALQT